MRRLSGQAARHAAVLLHRVAALAMALTVVAGAAVGALSWRLSQGPLEFPWLTQWVEAALNQDARSGHITIGSAALVWEGFRLGLERPLDIRLDAFAIADATGRQILTVPSAEISLSLYGLLFGRTTLRALEIDQARISLVRTEDGAITVASGVPEPNTTGLGIPGPSAAGPGAAASGVPGPGKAGPATIGPAETGPTKIGPTTTGPTTTGPTTTGRSTGRLRPQAGAGQTATEPATSGQATPPPGLRLGTSHVPASRYRAGRYGAAHNGVGNVRARRVRTDSRHDGNHRRQVVVDSAD